MAKTVLITLGRLPKALDLVRSFAGTGHRVLVADPHGWHLCSPSRDVARAYVVTAPARDPELFLDDLAAIIAREHVDLVVPVSEETLHVAGLLGRVAAPVAVFTMPQSAVLALHDKEQFIRHARSFGLDVPETHLLDEPAAAVLAARTDHVVKPVHSCAGRDVTFHRRGATLRAVGPERMLVQARVEGALLSTLTLAQAGRPVVTVVYRGVIMAGTVAVAFERVEEPAVRAWAERFVAASGWTGFIAFDVILDAAGRAHGIECNPRGTSGIHFLHGRDLAPAILEPEWDGELRLRRQLLLQQFWSCLTETQKAVTRPSLFRHHLKTLRTARDVTWDRRDPLPLPLMPITSWRILARSIMTGRSLGEIATDDIAWRA